MNDTHERVYEEISGQIPGTGADVHYGGGISIRSSFDISALNTTALRLFTSCSVYAITHKSDYNVADIGRKNQALFLILSDGKTIYYPIASLMVFQMYLQADDKETLQNVCDKLEKYHFGLSVIQSARAVCQFQ